MANTSIRIDTVGLGISWGLGETYRVAVDEGFVLQEGNSKMPMASNSSIMSFSTPADRPKISTSTPGNGNTAPIGIQSIDFTIDRTVGNLTVLGGNVYLYRQGSPNVVVKTYLVSNINTTGNTVSIGIVGNLEASQTYFITSNANIFLDRDGFKNNAISNSSSFSFISPTAPTVTALTPGNAAIASKNFINVTVNFDRTIFSNSGNLYLHNANSNAVIRTYAISSGLISNNKITLDIVGNINANGYYYVKSNANIVMDSTEIKYPGLVTNNAWLFQAPTNPYINSTSPAINANVSRTTTDISLTLDRTVTQLSGNVYLYNRATPNVLLKTWTIGSNVTFDSDKTFSVTVPQGMLAPTQNYFVTTTANIAKDLTYINYLGISSNTAYTFSTGEAPLLSSTSPAYGQAADENDSNISFTMDRLVNKNTGNLYLYKIDTVNGNSLVKTYNIVSNTYLVSNQTVNLPITNTLSIMESYYVSSDYDILKDYYNNEKYQGIINANTFVFTTAVNRSYVIDRTALLFPNNIPQITEADTGATYTVSLQLSSAIGQIQANGDNFASPTGWTAATRTYSVTGSKTTVNSALSNLYFFPFAGISSSANLTYSLTKNSIFQKSLVFSIASSANPGYLTGGGNTYSVAEDYQYNFMPFYIYPNWNSNCVVMLKSIQSANVAIAPGKFYANTASGWTNANDGVIYKAFSRPANIAVYNSQIAEVRDIYYWLASDYTTSFTIDCLLGIESTRSGNTLIGGTVYSATNTYNIVASGEYTLTTSSTYIEDTAKLIPFSIIDIDSHPSTTYNLYIKQTSPDPGLVTGAFNIGLGLTYGTLTSTRSGADWNNTNLYYYPPGDHTGSVTLDFSLIKIQSGQANIAQATNVAITLTNSSTENEYATNTLYYTEDTFKYFDSIITDTNDLSDLYYINIRQISPDPSAYPANILLNNVDLGSNAMALLSKSAVNSNSGFYPPIDYTGNVIFGYTQIRQTYNGNITQASNVAITANCISTDNESPGTQILYYSEDTALGINYNITDNDNRFNYYINIRQISPDPATQSANIYFENLGTWYTGGNVTILTSKGDFNTYNKYLMPPADYNGNIVLGLTQVKSTFMGNIVQASNVTITYICTSISSEYKDLSANVYFMKTTNDIMYNLADYNYANNLSRLSTIAGNANVGLILSPVVESLRGLGYYDFSSYHNTRSSYGGPTQIVYQDRPLKNDYTGLGVYEFDGYNHLRIDTYDSLQLATGNWTWEFWVRPTYWTSSTSYQPFIISYGANSPFKLKMVGAGRLDAIINNTTTTMGTLNFGWQHLAVVRNGSTVRIYQDGTQIGANLTASGDMTYHQSITFGATSSTAVSAATNFFTGHMDEIIFTKSAKYTGSFTPGTIIRDIAPEFSIIDTAQNKNYSVTITESTPTFGNLYVNGTNYGNTITLTGNANAINSNLANISILPHAFGITSNITANLYYSQTQTTNNILQVDNLIRELRIGNVSPAPVTQLLMHFEGADNSSTFTDSSANGFTFTRINSTAYISTADYKFGSASFYDSVTSGYGQGIYINGSRPSALQCQGDFTIEFFAKLDSSGAVQAAFGLGQALFNLVFIRDAGRMVVEKSTSGTYSSGFKELDFTLPSGCYGSWHHYAFVRDGNAAAFYVDGTACSGSVTGGGSASTFFSDGSPSTGTDHGGRTGVAIADNWYNSDYGFRGSYMDEFRFSIGVVYSSNFTPPSSAFTG